MKFGILSDILGQRDDVPHIKLPQAYACGESEWVYYEDSVMRRLPGRYKEFLDANGAAVVIPDGFPILRWHYHVSSSGTEYCLAFTKAHVYRWDSGAKVWDLLHTCASNCVRWSTADFGKYIVATNSVDKVQYWDDSTPATDFVPLGGASGVLVATGTYCTAAEFVIECENYLFFFSTTIGGAVQRYHYQWSTWADLTDFNEDGAGDAGSGDLEASRRIKGAGVLTAGGVTRLIVFSQNSGTALWLTESDLVWESETILNKIGCAAPDSIVNDGDGNLYYLATDRVIRSVGDNRIISGDFAPTVRNLHPSLVAYTQGVYVPSLNQLWWSVPSGPASTGNDQVLMYNLLAGAWHKAPMDICSFGSWTGQTTFSIDAIPFTTTDGIEWPYIDWAGQVAEYPFLICSDYAGYGYRAVQSQTDKGLPYAAKLVLATDMTQSRSLTEYKRIHGMWLFFMRAKNIGDTVAASVRGDSDEAYQMLGAVELSPESPFIEAWLPCDARFRSCKLKLESNNHFDFIGVIFDYDFDGDA
jgi:hypothetical protein